MYFAALAFWMPLLNRMPEFARLTRPVKILYLFVTAIPTTLPTIMLIFSTHVLYSAYAVWPQYLGWSNKADQEMAGAKYGIKPGTGLNSASFRSCPPRGGVRLMEARSR